MRLQPSGPRIRAAASRIRRLRATHSAVAGRAFVGWGPRIVGRWEPAGMAGHSGRGCGRDVV